MCKAHSKVTHIKQQKYFHHLKRPGYNTEFLLYPRPFRWWKYFCCFICVTLLWALHIVINNSFFYIYFNLKLGTHTLDYVADITHRATLGSSRPSGGFPPNRGNITPLWLFCYTVFFSRSRAQVEPSHWFLRWMAQMTCFRPRKCLLGVRTMGDVIWGNIPQKLPQKGHE